MQEFRWALLAGTIGMIALAAIGFETGALMVAIVLVPAIYLLYLHESQVYRHEPWLVVGLTLGGGLVLGVLVTLLTASLVGPISGAAAPLSSLAGTAPDYGLIFVSAVVVPLVIELIKPFAALALRLRAHFDETVDGLVFGVAAGLGFGAGESLVQLWGAFATSGGQGNWALPLLTVGLIGPLMHGSTTGAIAAALWQAGRSRLQLRQVLAIAAALVARVAYSLAGWLFALVAAAPVVTLGFRIVILGGLLIFIRYLLHHSLLEEAAHLGFAEAVCPNCHKHIVASGFCPNCGKALTAGSAAGRRRRDGPGPTRVEADALS